MNKEVKQVLMSWRTSLERYGKLDSWKKDKSLSILGDYLRSKEDTNSIRILIRSIRDKAICPFTRGEDILILIKSVLEKINPQGEPKECMLAQNGQYLIPKNGQEVRFRSETHHIFEEKLRFKDGMYLRNFDIETESASDSRKVRRIVEKRMCQAYHRMRIRRDDDDIRQPSNSDRYWEQRATAFQLYNIGQVENVKGVSRGDSTHWKRVYDSQTGKVVFKKKMAYPTEESAKKAICQWTVKHPNDNRKMHAYRCSCCNKWHIGHDNPRNEIKINVLVG